MLPAWTDGAFTCSEI